MNSNQKKRSPLHSWVFDVILIYALLAAAFFRLSGIYWGENTYLHPDERFLVWVGTDISPVDSLSQYFDTANSTLNPHNVGHGFYVYGTLPMFITRYVVEWVFGHSGFNEMTQVGRVLSTAADLMVVLLVYLVAERLYGKRTGALAACFSAAVVLQIQQSHFFTMDTFINTFSFLAFYFAIRVQTSTRAWQDHAAEDSPETGVSALIKQFLRDPLLLPSLGFGIALGMAVASKLNAAPMAIALPGAMLIGLLKMTPPYRWNRSIQAFIYLALAAGVSLLVFRIAQPYAFSGPGFFGLMPNPDWVANIRELQAQSGGNVDFPPAMQWARRPIWFSFQNLLLWGLGLPLGLLAWAGFLWAGWRMFAFRKYPNEWQQHALIWGWTAIYFTWQSLALNPTMRYQLPIYPMLTIFAAWAVITLYQTGKKLGATSQRRSLLLRSAALLTGAVVLLLTFAYAFAFSRLYVRPITRIEASRWIYQNIPGPINLVIQTGEGLYNQPIPFLSNFTITPGIPYNTVFQPKAAGTLREVLLPRVSEANGEHKSRTLTLTISDPADPDTPLASSSVTSDVTANAGEQGEEIRLSLEPALELDPEKSYNLQISIPGQASNAELNGQALLLVAPTAAENNIDQVVQVPGLPAVLVRPNLPYISDYLSSVDGDITQLLLTNVQESQGSSLPDRLRLSMRLPGEEGETLSTSVSVKADPAGNGTLLTLEEPLPVLSGENYILTLEMLTEGGSISLQGASIANEGDWDDGLPVRLDGYDGYGGIYPPGLNLNMYWDDNPDKLERFVRILDQADYLTISSNRQWGTLPRIQERFPMTTVYYRNLLGCPVEQTIEDCYRVAQPGLFEGTLGFDLVQVFDSPPSLGPVSLNDQFAEEAFSVYDHPKVLIFKKNEAYDSERLRALLSSVDFSKIIRIPPMQTSTHLENLLLPDFRWAEQQNGGTWSELFNTRALYNRFPALAAMLWYVCLLLLGWIVYPLLRTTLPGLADRGYPLARTAGMLILSYLVWLAGSYRIPFSRTTILVILLLMITGGVGLAYRQRKSLLAELRTGKYYFLMIEGLFLAFFIAFLLVRLGNPDLWHPWKGGEKPMDFSYFNAVLKSTSFPPYDPWFAGGALNYYYYGFVFVGTLVKLLGIVPSIAYNLILPTLFALIALGAFSVVWNLSQKVRSLPETRFSIKLSSFLPALFAAFGMAVFGNLGTVRMIYQGYQRLAAPNGVIEGANSITRLGWAASGFVKTLQGANLPYGLGDWYWIPSRAIPAPGDVEPITEFPYFTALYADLHAHLMALPITLLVLGCLAAFILGKGYWRRWVSAASWFALTGLAIGALRPTNTWDFPPYLVLGMLAVGYTLWNADRLPGNTPLHRSNLSIRSGVTLGGMALLAGLSVLLYQPFAEWYSLGYTKIDLWEGTHTPLPSYLIHWGLFLFLILSWVGWQTRDWLATTPLSALHRLRPVRGFILLGLLLLIIAIAGLLALGVRIAWFALPIAAWAGLLLLRPRSSDPQRIVLFLVGTGLTLTLMVEVIVLVGDIGRMNTVFKFYLQAWTFFSISAAVALGWLIDALPQWAPAWRRSWQIVFILLVAGAALYPLTATMAKVRDRISETTPITLDGMTYMDYSYYTDEWGPMDLSQDYRAIRWLQENVQGSPVIVEANLRNLYRWGSRYTINTGLPGVVGWEWHQQQQRAAVPGTWVSERIAEIDNFYLNPDLLSAQRFLRKYNVQYIIVGQQERGHYPGPGLDKFDAALGLLWDEVYRDGDTVIYKVIE
jgi:YYY domain-containing protein